MSFVRTHLKIPRAFVEEARVGPEAQRSLIDHVAERLRGMGLDPVRLVVQDPTDPERFTALGDVREALRRTDGIIRVEDSERIQEPSPPEPAPNDPQLDPGLNAAEVRSIRYALEHEVNPRHLTGFASTLEPWYPVAASRLRLRAALLEPGASFRSSQPTAVNRDQVTQARTEIETAAAKAGVPADLARLDVRKAIVRLYREPWLATPPTRTPAERAAALVVVPTYARAEKGARETLRIACPDKLRRVLPPGPRDGFVSPTALQLALATTGKPEISGVAYRMLAPTRANAIADPRSDGASREDGLALMRARDALDRAERCLERGRWTRWYDRMRTT